VLGSHASIVNCHLGRLKLRRQLAFGYPFRSSGLP
jgi:hypothetical protein